MPPKPPFPPRGAGENSPERKIAASGLIEETSDADSPVGEDCNSTAWPISSEGKIGPPPPNTAGGRFPLAKCSTRRSYPKMSDTYSSETGEKICHAIAAGQSLRAVCRELRIEKSRVIGWLENNSCKEFADQYARARRKAAGRSGENLDGTRLKASSIALDLEANSVAGRSEERDRVGQLLSEEIDRIRRETRRGTPREPKPEGAGGESTAADSFPLISSIRGIIKRWRHTRAEAAAKRSELEQLFESFLHETEPPSPQAPKHPKAALYRHAWKRAAVLEIIYQQKADQSLAIQFRDFQQLASSRYYKVAPDGPFGKVKLVMGEKAAARLLEFEIQRLSPIKGKQASPLACIYAGICEQGRVYVGQTVGAPEARWVQHRFGRTGPFKGEQQYVEWKVVEGAIDPAKLDERESYYIGFYAADTEGYNATRGNDWRAYERGQAERDRLSLIRKS
jgi:hypothetical protein